MIIKKSAVSRYEKNVFKHGVTLALVMIVVRLAHNLVIGANLEVLSLNVLLTFLFAGIYKVHFKRYQLATVLFYLIGGLDLFLVWNLHGGWQGPVPYTIFLLVIFIIITSHRWILASSLILVGLGLFFAERISLFSINLNYSNSSLAFDFILNTIVIISITYYLKTIFFKEKKQLEIANSRLRSVTNELSVQGQLLLSQTEELRQVKENQESLVLTTFNELQESGKILKEFSFTNSHIVRAPLSNILGLIHLIEQEYPNHEEKETFEKIKTEAQRIDTLIHDVAKIVATSRVA